MDAFAWGVVGSVAGVIGAVAAIVFGLVPLLSGRRQRAAPTAADAASADVTIVMGEIPQAPAAFQSRPALLAVLEDQA